MPIVVQTQSLTKRYGDVTALDALTLEVQQGEVLGYLGPNGAGKTTTIRLLLGLIKATQGSATIFGLNAQTQKEEVHKRLAYVPGETTLWPNLTGAETLHLLGQVHGSFDKGYRDKLTEAFQFDPSKKVRAYSKGNRQKLSLIAAFMTRPDLLLLDEPTSGLDPLMEQVFHAQVLEAKKNGQTIFLSSHILSEVEALCDRVAILRTGKLVEIGTLEQARHLSALTVEATFTGKAPDVSAIKNVKNVEVTEHHLHCQVHGSMEDLLEVLGKAHVTKLISREPSLEELFLSLYGDSNGHH